VKICLLGDTHTQHWNVKIPETDILIFAGDAEFRSVFDVLDFNIWLGTLPQKFIYCIAGNHDFYAQKRHDEICKFLTNATYLENELVTLPNKMQMWGSPITPQFLDWAFMSDRNTIHEYWNKIPKDIDILLTHGPAYGILDIGIKKHGHLGCTELAKTLKRVKPKYHIFGHIHGSYGIKKIDDTTFINCSVLNEEYKLINKPIIITI